MSNGGARGGRQPIEERTTSTILKQLHTAAPAGGAAAVSVLVGPAVDKRWLITHIGMTVFFTAAPAAGDVAEAFAQIINGVTVRNVGGVFTQAANKQGIIVVGVGTRIIIDNPEQVRVNVNAVGSTVAAQGEMVMWGFEFDDLQ